MYATNNLILQGDALTRLKELPSDSAETCVTSPPYYQLRDYGAEGQIGLEPTVQEYISKLVDVFREVRRVLKPDGTLWVNIADSYAGSRKGQQAKQGSMNTHYDDWDKPGTAAEGCKPKDLIGIPWLLALALRADGWYWRQVEIWEKNNVMPESVKDRCTNSHEYILLFSKSAKYYFNWEAIQEPCVGTYNAPPAGSKGTLRPNSRRRGNRKSFRGGGAYTNHKAFKNNTEAENETHSNVLNESGLRRKRTVWTVATKGSKYKHFATYPPKLIEPCILAGSREGGTVLDPFAGSGTTGEVAKNFNRNYVLIELSEINAAICRERLL